MAKQSRNVLKAWFETGDKPTQAQFWDWIDSYFHQDDLIPMASVNGLDTALESFATVESVAALKAIILTTTLDNPSLNVPAGTILHKVRLKSTAGVTYNLGTTVGGGQIIPAQTILANTPDIVTVDWDIEVLTTIHFSGLGAGTKIIKLYLLQ